MAAIQNFDAIIVGAGQAGPPLAGRLTAAGQRVAIVERKLFGGTCVNTGCMPTKTLVASARAAHVARRAADFGVMLDGGFSIDMGVVKARKDTVANNARQGVESWLKGMAGCTVFEGHARFVSATELEVDGERLAAKNIFLNVGGRASIPDMPGIDSVPYLTNVSVLELTSLPRHLVIVGGSYIALEFAQMYRRFGSEVTVIERGPRLIAREDEDVSQAVQDILTKEGISVHVNADGIRFAPRHTSTGEDIAVGVTAGVEVVGSHLLMAVGRRPNTDELQLEKAGVAVDARGFITVDDQLRTNVPGIWALGDCNGRGAFTHTSYNDFEIVAANLLDGGERRVSDRIETYALYIDPPLARVGLSEAQARRAGFDVRVGMRPMTRVGRAVEKGETAGFMKIVVDAKTQTILGGTMLGVEADEAIHGILDTMAAKAPYPVLQQAMHIHPTVSELIPTLLSELKP